MVSSYYSVCTQLRGQLSEPIIELASQELTTEYLNFIQV